MAKERTDAERSNRQCARFGRIARLVTGNGRWRPDDLAKELECSTRTIYLDVRSSPRPAFRSLSTRPPRRPRQARIPGHQGVGRGRTPNATGEPPVGRARPHVHQVPDKGQADHTLGCAGQAPLSTEPNRGDHPTHPRRNSRSRREVDRRRIESAHRQPVHEVALQEGRHA